MSEMIIDDELERLSFDITSEYNNYYIQVYIRYENKNFKGGNNCYFCIWNINDFVRIVNSFDFEKLKDSNYSIRFALNDQESASNLTFEKIDKFGHFKLEGILENSSYDCRLSFVTGIDQTVLIKIANFFEKNCNINDAILH